MRSFLASMKKNFKNLFRNWASLFLIIIGPLILMAIIFAAFSDLGFKNVHIGYVVEQPEKIAGFLDSISYVGSFDRYDSIDDCKHELQRQNAHACLDVSTDNEVIDIAVYVDNTREIISYILYGQIHRAMIRERQNIITSQMEDSMHKLNDISVFILDTKEKLTDTVDVLGEQRSELYDTKNELAQARSKIVQKQSRLRELRSDLTHQRNRISGTAESLYSESITAINDARNTLNGINSQLVALGVHESVDLSPGYNALNDQQNSINRLKNDFDRELSQFDALITEIDRTITELDEAISFIDQTNRKILQAISRIDSEKSKLVDFNDDLSTKRRDILDITRRDVRSFATPIETHFNQLFSGSDRARDIELSMDLSDETKARLLNFGSIQTLLPFILAITICFISIILANIMTLDEIHSPAFTRNVLAKGTRLARMLALFTTIFLTSFVQVVLIWIIGFVVFLLDLNVLNVLIPLVLMISIYAILGMVIAYFVNDKSTSLLVASFVMIINLFLSGTVYPVERMSALMEYVAKTVPFTSGLSMLQQGIFYGISLSEMLPQIITLILILLFMIGVLLLAKWVFLRRKLRQ